MSVVGARGRCSELSGGVAGLFTFICDAPGVFQFADSFERKENMNWVDNRNSAYEKIEMLRYFKDEAHEYEYVIICAPRQVYSA